MVGGRLIEILNTTTPETRTPCVRLWCMDRNGDECCVYAEPSDEMPKLGDEVWWQSGRIYFDGDRKSLRKIGNSFGPPTVTR